ncbi:MAG: CBS domain-containing protein [Acidobacteriia bacterium]|nr:CBS domain-containing protein [Terriglobia bacterium]
MTVENIMTKEPQCCSPEDTVQVVAQLMKKLDVGAIPVIADQVSKRLVGIITDRDLCITAMAEGKDPRTTKIAPYFTKTVVTCMPGDTLEVCEQKMKLNKIRRILVVDAQYKCLGIVVQADLARVEKPEAFRELVAEISKPKRYPSGIAVA